MSMLYVGVGSLILGAGTSIYGANKQAKTAKAASVQNADSLAAQNASAWSNYLLTRGLNPAGATTGSLPSQAQAVNSRLPLWANANFKTPGGGSKWVKRGSAQAPNSLDRSPTFIQPAVAPTAAGSGSSGGPSRTNDILIGNPLGIGGKDRNFLDPLGIF